MIDHVRITICWPQVSGYLAAAWRELAAVPGMELRVLAFGSGADAQAPFKDRIVEGVSCELLDEHQRMDAALIARKVIESRPDVVVLPGWFHEPYRELIHVPQLKDCRFMMTMDTPWRGLWRQRLTRWRFRGYLRRIDAVVTAGERAWQYAVKLGFAESRVYRGMYCYDARLYAPVAAARRYDASSWPRRFLYVGRYVPEKGLDTLIEAYRRYRAAVSEPWGLTCCGSGPLKPMLAGEPGVEDRGFLQPDELPKVLTEHGALVIASRFEPWGVVIAEAAGSGLPVICTHACGAGLDVVRPWYNGLVVGTGDAVELARAMHHLHDHPEDAAAMGGRGPAMTEPFSAVHWARRMTAVASGIAETTR